MISIIYFLIIGSVVSIDVTQRGGASELNALLSTIIAKNVSHSYHRTGAPTGAPTTAPTTGEPVEPETEDHSEKHENITNLIDIIEARINGSVLTLGTENKQKQSLIDFHYNTTLTDASIDLHRKVADYNNTVEILQNAITALSNANTHLTTTNQTLILKKNANVSKWGLYTDALENATNVLNDGRDKKKQAEEIRDDFISEVDTKFIPEAFANLCNEYRLVVEIKRMFWGQIMGNEGTVPNEASRLYDQCKRCTQAPGECTETKMSPYLSSPTYAY